MAIIQTPISNPHPPSRCSLCGSSDLRFLFSTRDKNQSSPRREFDVAECSTCRAIQTLPKLNPDELQKFYPREYFPASAHNERYYETVTRAYQRDKIAIIKSVIPDGILLDVGCGVGYFLREVSEAGYSAHGIEISTTAAEFGRKKWGLDIREGDFVELESQANTYDVVTLWHSFEHFADPKSVLHKLALITRPGGYVVIAVPNFNSYQSKIFGRQWYHLDVPRHFFHYTPNVLSDLFRRHDFEVRSVLFWSREHNWAGIYGSIANMGYPGEPLYSRVIRKTIGKWISGFFAAIESVLQRGGTFTVIAQKTPHSVA